MVGGAPTAGRLASRCEVLCAGADETDAAAQTAEQQAT